MATEVTLGIQTTAWERVKDRAKVSLPWMVAIFAAITLSAAFRPEAIDIKTAVIIASTATPVIWIVYSLLGIRKPKEEIKNRHVPTIQPEILPVQAATLPVDIPARVDSPENHAPLPTISELHAQIASQNRQIAALNAELAYINENYPYLLQWGGRCQYLVQRVKNGGETWHPAQMREESDKIDSLASQIKPFEIPNSPQVDISRTERSEASRDDLNHQIVANSSLIIDLNAKLLSAREDFNLVNKCFLKYSRILYGVGYEQWDGEKVYEELQKPTVPSPQILTLL